MKWPDHLHPEEFEEPDKLHSDLVAAAGVTRAHLGRPMNFSRTRSGVPLHPQGDAVGPYVDSHSRASLHRYGIDHTSSAREGAKIIQANTLCRALDWDAGDPTVEALYETYLEIERLNVWNAIGIYPKWNRLGFHTDIRTESHPSYGARWICFGPGDYRDLTWAEMKRAA